jgi:hypothetical protein
MKTAKAPDCIEENHSHCNPLKVRVHSHPDQNAIILPHRWAIHCKIVEVLGYLQHVRFSGQPAKKNPPLK